MANDCIFCSIIEGKVPTKKVGETEQVVIINDIAPKAGIHYLIIPKKHVAMVDNLDEKMDGMIAGSLLLAAKQIAQKQKISAYRLVINNGEAAGQSVFHLHMHLLAGERIPGMLSTEL